jgi:hypothetical protein
MAPGPPLGQWNIVTNLNNGLLNVEDFDPVTGTIQFNQTDIYNISGSFEEDVHGNQQSINFSYTFRSLIGGLYIPISISFVGCVFEAGQPLFSSMLGPTSPDGGVYLMAGTWHHSFSSTRRQLPNGWVAQSITFFPSSSGTIQQRERGPP